MDKRRIYSVKSKIKTLFGGTTPTDDFDWELYHVHYQGELSDIAKRHSQILSPGDYSFEKNELVRNHDILPLHPNHRLLYETILQLSPSSIMEIGCGGGDHLWNLSVLAPSTKLYGRDISIEQINLLRERHPRLRGEIEQLDATLPHPHNSPKVDIAFIQAVIMHIKTGNGHLVALVNLFQYATKQVILMENWNSHNFMEDISLLFSKRMLPWNNIYMYYRDSKEFKKHHIMIVSSVPINVYKGLTEYSLLEGR